MDKLQSIRCVAFDLDGTLVDSALYALKLPQAGESRMIIWIGNSADVLMARAIQRASKGKPDIDTGDVPQAEQIAMLRKLFNRYYEASVEEGSFLFPDVAQTLAALHAKGLPLALVTNKSAPFVAPLLNAPEIAHYFTFVVIGDDVVNKKPHPEPLLLVCAKLAIQPHELFFVGDSHNDIRAAQAAGSVSVGLTYGYNYGEAITLSEPDYVFDHFKDLLPALGLSLSEHQEMKND